MVDGRAATINWANKYVPAIIHAWFPGEFMGDAIAKVLFGDYNPGGRLAVTFPKSVGQIPFAFPFKPGSDSKGKVRVDGVLYPFGYGLSYTTFGYSDLKISKPVIGPQENITLSCTVKNTGKKAGDEVVQLYIGMISAALPPTIKYCVVSNVFICNRVKNKPSALPLLLKTWDYGTRIISLR